MRTPWYCDEDVQFEARTNWMADLPDDMEIGQFSIPGTHETCARRGGPGYVCQGLGLADQLRAGIRFLDIRCRHFERGLMVEHQGRYQGYWFHKAFQSADHQNPCVLDTCIEFLTANKSECIIMALRPEPWDSDGEEDAKANGGERFSDCVCKSINITNDVWYESLDGEGKRKPRPPVMKDVRGKIILVRHFKDDYRADWSEATKRRAWGVVTWPDDPLKVLREQDEYPVYSWSLGAKFNKVAMASDRARARLCWCVNYTSGSEGLDPSTVAKSINPRVGDYIAKCRATTGPDGVGMLAMDFPGEQLIADIINLNYSTPPVEPTTLWLADEFGGILQPVAEDNHVRIPAGRLLGDLELKCQRGFGVVNMRFFDTAGNLLWPTRPMSDRVYGGGWVTTDFDGDAPVRMNGPLAGGEPFKPIDGLQFAKHQQWGIVNVRVHLQGEFSWRPWLTPFESSEFPETDPAAPNTAECVSEPRAADGTQKILWIETWKQGGHGLVDGRFGYGVPPTDPVTQAYYFLRSGQELQRISLGGRPPGVVRVIEAARLDADWKLNTAFDFNGDGIPDIFGHRQTTGDLRVWYGTPSGEYKRGVPLGNIGPSWQLQVARFVRGGGVDIFGHNRSEKQDAFYQEVRVWRTNGRKVVRDTKLGNIGLEWDLQLGDFNGDGILDILGVNTHDGKLYVWFFRPQTDGTFDGPLVTVGHGGFGQIGREWSLQVADMNNDGYADIFGHTANNDLWVWNNVGNNAGGRHLDGGRSFGKLGTEWQQLQVADLNGDGLPDLLGQATNGELRGWYSNGRAFTSDSNLGWAPGAIPQAGGNRLR